MSPVWDWFGLSRAAYTVFSRRALCSMPVEWQTRFVELMQEAEAVLPDEALNRDYWVRCRVGNRFVSDPDSDYRHCTPYNLKRKETK